jgi:hypothetical protein
MTQSIKKRRKIRSTWREDRERLRNNPQHQKLAKQHCSRGTHRDLYLALDRIFHVTGDPEYITIQTKDGPRLLSRDVHLENEAVRLENKKIHKSRRRNREQRKARANQRRIQTRGKHRH